MSDIYDIIIIGGGPAGLTAGIYATRGLMKTLTIERISPGGQIASTDKVENFPGFPDGINGFEWSNQTLKQAKKFGLEVTTEDVKEIEVRIRKMS